MQTKKYKRIVDYVGISADVRELVTSCSDHRVSPNLKQQAMDKAIGKLDEFVSYGIMKYKGDQNILNEFDDIRSVALQGLSRALLKDNKKSSALPWLSQMIGMQAAQTSHRQRTKNKKSMFNQVSDDGEVYGPNDSYDIDEKIYKDQVKERVLSASLTLPPRMSWTIRTVYLEGVSPATAKQEYITKFKTSHKIDFDKRVSGSLESMRQRLVDDMGSDGVNDLLSMMGSDRTYF